MTSTVYAVFLSVNLEFCQAGQKKKKKKKIYKNRGGGGWHCDKKIKDLPVDLKELKRKKIE